MYATLLHLFLLADRARWQRLGDNFRQGRSGVDFFDVLYATAIVIGFIAGMLVLARMASRGDKPRRNFQPRGLFRELCAAHALTRAECGLLARIAKSQNLEHPGRLFVEPARLADSRLPAALKESREELASLRTRLFAALPAAEAGKAEEAKQPARESTPS